MFETRIFRSIASIDADAWNACFVGDPETHEYLRAVEEAGLPGFDWRYFVVTIDGCILAAAPGFITAYPLDTTLGAAQKKAIAALRRALPTSATSSQRLSAGSSPDHDGALHARRGLSYDCGISARRARVGQRTDRPREVT